MVHLINGGAEINIYKNYCKLKLMQTFEIFANFMKR